MLLNKKGSTSYGFVALFFGVFLACFIVAEVNYKSIKKSWKSAVKVAGIENFMFHDLRHTFAMRLIEKNIDIVVAKELMGHADISTTMIYVHSDADRKKNAINVIDDY